MRASRILIDADALVALVDKGDTGYRWATQIQHLVKQKRWTVYLSSQAYGEALMVISMKLGLQVALKVAGEIEDSDMIVVDVNGRQRQNGLRWFSRQKSKNVSFTDCVNMALMEELKIREIFSRDLQYKKNGFVRLGIDE